MSELISGKEAKLAWANGEALQFFNSQFSSTPEWKDLSGKESLNIFDAQYFYFRLKPRTITLNGIEVPAPDYIVDTPHDYDGTWEINIGGTYLLYKSQKDYDVVVTALRSAFKGKAK